MTSIMSSALGGMQAATRKVSVGASNIANAQTIGTPGATGKNAAYQPVDAVQFSGAQNVPQTKIVPRNPGTSLSYQPGSPLASNEGFVEAPNVDIASELVNNKIAQRAYEANIRSIITWDEMQATLLDIKS
jgi:flagellar basal-body rod protein FlgC